MLYFSVFCTLNSIFGAQFYLCRSKERGQPEGGTIHSAHWNSNDLITKTCGFNCKQLEHYRDYKIGPSVETKQYKLGTIMILLFFFCGKLDDSEKADYFAMLSFDYICLIDDHT